MLLHTNNLELKSITENELDAILFVYRQSEDFLALGPHPKASIEMVLNDLAESRKESGCFCGIYEDGKMIGVVDFAPVNFKGENGFSKISLLMIATLFRRKGVGTIVVNMVEEEIVSSHHSRTIDVAVQANNAGALRFWQRLGYEIFDGPELRPDKTTVYYLQKTWRAKDT